MSAVAIHDEKKKDWSAGFVWPVWDTDALPVWAPLCREREDALCPVSTRLAPDVIEEIGALSSRFGDEMTSSASVRLLVALGLGVVRDVEHYAPELFGDAIREGDTVRGNSARLVSMLSPLVDHAIGNYGEALPYV